MSTGGLGGASWSKPIKGVWTIRAPWEWIVRVLSFAAPSGSVFE